MPTSQTLTRAEYEYLQQLQEETQADLARARLEQFCTRLNPNLVFQRYHQEIFTRLEALERNEIENLIIALPPRHSKSEIVSNNFPAWYLGRNPEHQVIMASYGLGLATRNSRRARNKLLEAAWPFPDVKLADDSKAVEYWGTSDGGEVLAAGIDSTMTGYGAHILAIDDPFKNRADADSLIKRDAAWAWYTDDAIGRLMPGGHVVLCSTRWHEDDLTGRILNQEGALNDWEVLSLPALAEADDPLGRPIGEPLDPIRYPREALLKRKRRVGPRAWNALYQQRPGSTLGNLFRRAWWRFYNPAELIRRGLQPAFISVDPAIGGGTDNDYSAATVWGELDGQFYCLDIWAEKVPYTELRPHLLSMYDTWKCPLLVEDAGVGKILLQELRQASKANDLHRAVPTIPWKLNSVNRSLGVNTNQLLAKRVRAEVITPQVEGGLCYLPLGHPRLELFLEQHSAFPTGTHDDLVDTTVMAIARLAEQVDAAFDIYLQSLEIAI